MDLFDDALSEDWISQPGSSGPGSVRGDSPPSNKGSATASSTRPPRRVSKNNTSGFLESRHTGSRRHQPALGEKRPSQLNSKSSALGARSNKVSANANRSLASSPRSSLSIRQGTVLQNDKRNAGKKDSNPTPEWKRRLVAGRSKPGQQRDLFSSTSTTALENVFNAPEVSSASGASASTSRLPAASQEVGKTKSPTTAAKKMPLGRPKANGPVQAKSGSPLGSPKVPVAKAIQPHPKSLQQGPRPPRLHAMEHKSGVAEDKALSKVGLQVSDATTALRQLVIQDAGSSAPSSRQSSAADPYRYITYDRGNLNSDVTSLERVSDLEPSDTKDETSQDVSLANDESITQRPQSPRIGDSPPRPGGSPLKLFGKYDTYTNDRIARRVNQFEDDEADGSAKSEICRDESFSAIQPKSYGQLVHGASLEKQRKASNFGVGELDEFSFEHQDTSGIEIDSRPRVVTSRTASESHVSSRLSSRRVSRFPSLVNSTNFDAATDSMNAPLDITNEEGKRLLNSPRRVPEAKRRRTSPPLPDWDNAALEKPERQYRDAEYVTGRKRKDARYTNNYPIASPDVIASRRMLRPKGPYSLGRRASKSEKGIVAEPDAPDDSVVLDLAKYAEESDDEVIESGQGVRKKSVTTADFFKEANLIMQNIRAQAQPSTFPIRRPSEETNPPESNGSYNEEFTMEQLSRPASREGSYRRRPHGMLLNARVVSHLRKFEEKDDADFSIAQIDEESLLSDEVHSDPPNIRIRNSRLQETLQADEDFEKTNQSKSQSSSDHATEKSLPTASSAGSAPKATISPDKVSHLLSRTMGGMTFDETKGCWVKTRLSASANIWPETHSIHDVEDDDPFNAIPDLTIDESQEILAVRGFIRQASSTRFKRFASEEHAAAAQPKNIVPSGKPTESFGDDASSIISKYTHFASSGPAVETRATSWGDLALRRSKSEYDMHTYVHGAASTQRTMSGRLRIQGATASQLAQDDNTSAAINETHSPRGKRQPAKWACGSPGTKSDGEVDYAELSIEQEECSSRYIQKRQLSRIESATSSQLFDSDQENIDPKESRIARVLSADQVEPALLTPRTESRFDQTILVPSSAGPGTGDLQLTPLPDFTINQPDESLQLDVGYVARRQGLLSRGAVEGRFSMAIRDLVARIQDVEPHEPYWEFLRRLDLQKCSLLTLHMLNEFCGRVEDLNVSGNQLGQLNGAPLSLRVLTIRNNCLSNLTAFHHLPNLQYVDVSGNAIATLKPFKGLIHLRELNIESNDLEDTEGLEDMSQLISLKIGHNRIRKLDLRAADLPRLITLDAHNNGIHNVNGLSELSALQELNLRQNELRSFRLDSDQLSRSLQHLDLSMNSLEYLDLTDAPALKSLAVDHNHLKVLDGLETLRSVEAISWSHQGTANSRTLVQFECCSQTQFLNLSGNSLTNFTPKAQFLNLRRLELASCGLEVLGNNLGTRMPNLRVLNLNDNGLKDIRPLLGIAMLEELHLARNRISRLRLTTSILHHFASTLRVLDLRENPVTLAFYPPVRPNQIVSSDRETNDDTVCSDCDRSCSTAFLNMIPTDENDDNDYQTRLDEETLLRRRVYEALVLCHCIALDTWDGMAMDKRCFADGEATWTRLVELGVLKRKQSSK